MSALPFCFVLHLHQPVGNFDHVFRDHAVDVYGPFLDFLEGRDLWPIGLHVSGPLLEWLGEHDAALHDRIGRLADDGRIELLSGGWYEPILAALSREDRATQIGWMREELESRFGVTPRGLWLAERVWEPDLPRDLSDAGIEYCLVDDHLATRAGVSARDLQRPLRTEAGGRQLDVLLIDERLRYLIPFRPAEEIEEELRARCDAGEPLALIGDDGEKFGGWPRTREWLYDEGWLDDFGERMTRLCSEGVVRLVTPGQARVDVGARGPVYLPSGSYMEMEGWAPGRHWKGFLQRYDEANRIHKRMSALSALCRERGDPPEARRAIGRAQCNDAYWHGVFGGLYMKHLREGVRGELLRAERALRAGEPLAWTAGDHAASGRSGWWAHGAAVSAWIDTAYGGTVTDLLWLGRGVDVVDVLTRRTEEYHREAVMRSGAAGVAAVDAHAIAADPVAADPGADAVEAVAADAGADAIEAGAADAGAAPSIHDIEKDSRLDRLPPVDPEPRALLRDRVLLSDLDFARYRDGELEPVWVAGPGRAADPDSIRDDSGWSCLVWRFEATGGGGAARGRPAGGARVQKSISLRDDGVLTVSWRWDPSDFPVGSLFAPELSLGAPVSVALDPHVEAWRYPIVTVSKCPDGFEEIEQGESVTPRWPIELGRAQVTIGPLDGS